MKPSALIVVDVQEDFVEGGSLACPGGRDLASRISEYAADSDHVIVASRDWHTIGTDNGGHFANRPDYVDTWPAHCIAGTPGADYAAELILPARAYHVRKGQNAPAYSAFQGTRPDTSSLQSFVTGPDVTLEALLRDLGIEQVLVCGIALSYCVKATVLDSVQLGFQTFLLAPLCVDVAGQDETAVYNEVDEAGAYIALNNTLAAK